MITNVKESTVVRPAAETPSVSLWLSNVDLVVHSLLAPSMYFYRRPTGAANFFDAAVLKAALSRALVTFYPVAGRLKKDKDGRIEVDCNGEGVLFVEAESDEVVESFGDFASTANLEHILIPQVDYSKGISSYPLLVVQITRFKCGGVSLGIGLHHLLADGIAALHFVNTWSDIARGDDITVLPPFFDRTLLRARNPPQPKFSHVEFDPPPALKAPQNNPSDETSFSIFKLTRAQLNSLKSICNDESEKMATTYTTYEVVAGHVWRCVSEARGLAEDQETKLYIMVNGRSKFQPPLPQGYFGNVIYPATPAATFGDLKSNPLRFAVSKIHEAIAGVNNDRMRSGLDYLELKADLSSCARGPHSFRCPNIVVTSWVRLPFYDADFGWDRPMFVGPGAPWEGKCLVMEGSTGDGSISLAITLQKERMRLFKKLLYNN